MKCKFAKYWFKTGLSFRRNFAKNTATKNSARLSNDIIVEHLFFNILRILWCCL